jgi:hypothetical protein
MPVKTSAVRTATDAGSVQGAKTERRRVIELDSVFISLDCCCYPKDERAISEAVFSQCAWKGINL